MDFTERWTDSLITECVLKTGPQQCRCTTDVSKILGGLRPNYKCLDVY